MRLTGVMLCTLPVLTCGTLSAQASELSTKAAPSAIDGTQTQPSSAIGQETSAAMRVSAAESQIAAHPESLAQPIFSSASNLAVAAGTPIVPATSQAQLLQEPTQNNSAAEEVVNLAAKQPERLSPSTSNVASLQESAPAIAQVAQAESGSTGTTPADSQAQKAAGNCVQIAQATGTQRCPRPEAVAPLTLPEVTTQEVSPGLSIFIPVGYGSDNNTVWLSGTYQSDVRVDDFDAAAFGVGVGLGDADKAVGAELSYAFANNEDFGEGGFNLKLHRRFAGDVGAAVGWNGFLNVGRNDFEHSFYGVVTKVFRLQESVDSLFSRVAVTVGVGNNMFRSNGASDAGLDNANVFGNIALRVARPVSFITEWTGQDLALGLSIAPFRNIPFVITPAVRDLVSADDRDPRFVLGAGFAFSF